MTRVRTAAKAPPPRRAAIITMAVLPLVVGVVMAIATGMWMFLAFTAVSAVSVLLPVVEGRAARLMSVGSMLVVNAGRGHCVART